MSKLSMLFVTQLHFNKDGNGGQQRTYYLIKGLSEHFNLHVLSPYTNADKIDITANFILNKSVSFKKISRANNVTRLLHKILNLLLKREEVTKPIHQSNFTTYILKKQLNTIKAKYANQHIDTIVFDTLSMAVKINPELFKNRILNAHNFDSELVQTNLDNKINDPKISAIEIEKTKIHLANYERYEHHVDQYFTEVWVCSDKDAKKFKEVNPQTKLNFYVLPNGSDTSNRQFQTINNDYHKMLFVGSLNYFPNYNGLRWFVEHVFKYLPDNYHLNIVGKSPNTYDFSFLEPYPNINLIGEVDTVAPHYKNHDVFVVPLLEGSGTRLKILEAMSYGKLVLSTAKGIEGINALHDVHYLEFNSLKDFKSLFNIFEDDTKLLDIRKNGRQLIEEHYSWKSIVHNYVKQKNGK